MIKPDFELNRPYLTAGFSMNPLLRNGDTVYLEPAAAAEFVPGDLIAFADAAGTPVVHRVVATNPLQSWGDNNARPDAVDLAASPLARVVRIERDGQVLPVDGGEAGLRQFRRQQQRRRRRAALLKFAHAICRLLPVKVRSEALEATAFGETTVYYWRNRAVGTYFKGEWQTLWLPGAFFIKIPRRSQAPELWPLLGAIGDDGVLPANRPGTARDLFSALSPTPQEAVCVRGREAGMSALLYYTLADALPESYRRGFQADYYAQVAWNLRCSQTLDELRREFTAWNVPFICLKGAFFGEKVYPTPAVRFRRDLDLLIRREDAERVFPRLREAGWIPRERDMRRNRPLCYRHHLPSLYRENAPELELHWHIFKDISLPPETLWQYSAPTGAGTEYMLAPEVHSLLLAYNMYFDSWELAERSLLDMALLRQKFPLDPELLLKLNREFGLGLDLGLPYAVFPEFFTAAGRLFASDVPAASRTAIRRLASSSFARQVDPFLADPPDATRAAPFRILRQQLRNLPGLLHKSPAKRDREKWRWCRILDRTLPRYRDLHQAARQSHGKF